jgi:protein LTV1
MGKSKKKFIDKKNASTFHLLHRSQRDVNNDGGGGMVLWPSPDNAPETNERVLGTMDSIKQELNKLGLVDDFDYESHLRPVTGSGVVLDASGKVSRNNHPSARDVVVQDDEIKEVSRQLESIALTPDCMDDDVALALFGDFDEGDYEEILDDFCITAAQEPDEVEEQEFDYDEHIRNLMEKARRKTRGEYDGVPVEQHAVGKSHQEYFSSAKPLHGRDNDDDESGEYDYDQLLLGDSPGIVSSLDPQEEKALCEKFEQTLAEYDSDEVGDLDQECEEIRGDRPLEGDALLETAMDEYLEEKRDEIFMEGTRRLAEKRRTGGSSFAALVGKQLVHASDLKDQDLDVHEEIPLDEVLEEAKDILANPVEEPPAEEILIDGKSYFSERTRNPWDCESILSTYSNLDNNPVTIESKRRQKKKKTKQISPEQTLPEDEPVRIQLSSKTGLPLGVLSSRYDEQNEDDDTMFSRNRGEARKKNETKEEKKARKLAVKKEREIARLNKKLMKDAFKDEFAKRSEVTGDDVGGKSVFRYS